jgi:hypothetical protein
MLKLWVATDRDGNQFGYKAKTTRMEEEPFEWEDKITNKEYSPIYFDDKLLPSQTWEDEPVEVYIVSKEFVEAVKRLVYHAEKTLPESVTCYEIRESIEIIEKELNEG